MDLARLVVEESVLDWTNDGYHKLTVTFAYTRWKNNSLENFAMDAIEYAIAQGLNVLSQSRLGTDLAPVDDRSVYSDAAATGLIER